MCLKLESLKLLEIELILSLLRITKLFYYLFIYSAFLGVNLLVQQKEDIEEDHILYYYENIYSDIYELLLYYIWSKVMVA
jgi:hypothetical protein